MKKTISINISGVIFHIEEDGYEKLRSYLTSIQHYFSTYEDSQEIITDIENRIAEKLLAKLKTGEKQVVSIDDVNELIQSMGTVADFEAIEEEDIIGANAAGSARPQSAYEPAAPTGGPNPENRGTGNFGGPVPPRPAAMPPRRLYRDLRRKIAGGVASGIANYFNIDPVWVRLIFLTVILALPPFSSSFDGGGEFFGSLSGITVLLYIAMWIAFPGSMSLEDDKSVKKFYRNPDDKVLGGVASGIGAYFGIDSGVVRLLFVLTIFLFGTGLLAYIILWIISPEANTLTEKMEMQGEPITLSNIESNIKRSLNIDESSNVESTVTKVLLFPFRLIATVVNGLANVLGPLARGIITVTRVLAGVLLVVIGFAIMIGALGMLGAAFGLKGVHMGDVPFNLIRNEINPPMILSAFVAVFLPGLAVAVLGVMLISKRALVTTGVSLALLSVWFLSLLGLAITVLPLINEFNRTGIAEETQPLRVPVPVPTLDVADLDNDGNFRTSIELEGIDRPDWQLLKRFEAKGPTRQQAQQNARTVVYNFAVRDSLIRFDDSYEIKSDAPYRDQRAELVVYVPYERPFRMTEAFARHIQNEFGERELERMKTTLWKFTKADGLVSINYPREYSDEQEDQLFDTDDAIDETLRNELGEDFFNKGEYTRLFDVTNFSKLNIGGAFAVRVKQGAAFKVVADGREEDIDDLRVLVENGELRVKYNSGGLLPWRDRRRIGLTITMPTLQSIQFTGATQSSITGFENVDTLNVNLTGACKILVDVKGQRLDLGLTGASKAQLRGRIQQLSADLSGACKLDAMEMKVGRADVEASGASKADFGEVNDLHSNTSGASNVSGPNRQEVE